MSQRSVHLTTFPNVSSIPSEATLVAAMDRVREVCSAGLSIRSTENIRTRQPLERVTLYGDTVKELAPFSDVIADELNVKNVLFSEELKAVADYKLQLNFPVLGKRLPDKMKQLIPASKKGEWKKDASGNLQILGETLLHEEYSLLLEAKEKKGKAATSAQDILVALDLNLSPQLISEGIARDVVRLIQQARKEAKLNVSDRLLLAIESNEEISKAVAANEEYVKAQTLTKTLKIGANAELTHQFSNEIDGVPIKILFSAAT